MTGAFAAAVIALGTGFGVYRSCVTYPNIRRQALCLDAVWACASIFIFYMVGAFN
jgi:hypothetical protein